MCPVSSPPLTNDLRVSFSHVHLYVDCVESLDVYENLEAYLNCFHAQACSSGFPLTLKEKRTRWESLTGSSPSKHATFSSQNRDVIKQLMVGFGFRVTGYRYPEQDNNRVTAKSLLVTSRDPSGIQIVVSAATAAASGEDYLVQDDYFHFDVGK